MAIQAHLYSENLGFPMCGSQDLMMVDNGCSGGGGFGQFAFNVQQQKLQHLQQQQQLHMQEIQNNQQQRNQSFWFENNFPVSASKNNFTTPSPTTTDNTLPSMAYPSHSLAAQVEKHRQEIDQYLKSQVRKNLLSNKPKPIM